MITMNIHRLKFSLNCISKWKSAKKNFRDLLVSKNETKKKWQKTIQCFPIFFFFIANRRVITENIPLVNDHENSRFDLNDFIFFRNENKNMIVILLRSSFLKKAVERDRMLFKYHSLWCLQLAFSRRKITSLRQERQRLEVFGLHIGWSMYC